MKKVFSMLVILLLCFSMPVKVSAKAVSESVAQPCYEKLADAQARLYINGTTATCRSSANGHSDVTKIVVVQTLEKYSGWFWIWNDVEAASWTKTVYSNTLIMSNTRSGLTSGTYRLKSVITLTDKNGKSETITVYSNEKKI